MSQPPADDLRRTFAARTNAAVDAAKKSDGDVPADELEKLERLERLLRLQTTAAERPPSRSWQVAGILFATLVVVSVLLFARVRETEIELEVEATQISFSIDTEQVLFEQVNLKSIGASGLAKIALPEPIAAALGSSASIQDPDAFVRLSVAEIEGRRGAIGVSEIKPTKPTVVDIRLKGRDGEYRVSMQDPAVTIEVAVVGPVQVTIAGVGSQLIDLPIPQSIALDPAPANSLDLDLIFVDLEHAAMTPQVPVSGLEFWRVDEFGDRKLSVLRSLSTIVGGKVYFEALNGESRSLRASEVLRLPQAKGEIRTLEFKSDRLSMGFHGNVQGMSTGTDPSVRSLMPTWLEWLQAQHGLSLLWGTTLYLAGLAMAALRWFKGSL